MIDRSHRVAYSLSYSRWKHFLHTAQRIVYASLLGLAVVYSLGYGVWRVLLLTPLYANWWWLPLSEIVGSWFYLPLLPLVLSASLLRHRRMLIVLSLPLLMFGVEYGRQFLPNWQLYWTDSSHNLPLRVMTWNTLYTSDRNQEFQRLLQRVQPDIVALQEVRNGFPRSLNTVLNDLYTHRQVYSAGTTRSLAILSRYPILDAMASNDLEIYRCTCVYVTIDFHGKPITVLTAHPPRPVIELRWRWRGLPRIDHFDTENQRLPFESMQQRIDAFDGPLIVLGDLNTTERQPNYRRLRQRLDDAFGAAGWGMGYSYPRVEPRVTMPITPLIRIDHILTSRHWIARTAWTGQLSSSDHLYVVADLALLAN